MFLTSYVRFAQANAQLVGFGFLMTFASSFGQTYFIGVFGPSVQAEFGLSHSAWGSIYMAGTFASAALLPWSGKQIDRLDLRLYTVIVVMLLAFACFSVAAAASPLMLIAVVFLLRHSGQGLASHTAITTMARYFDAGRGRAIAIATLGTTVGQAVLPFAAVVAIVAIGWRWSYAGVGVVTLFFLLPAAYWLLKGHAERHTRHVARDAAAVGTRASDSWTRSQVLRDVRFWLVLPGLTAPSLIMTAMFFHHLSVAEAKGWSATWITGNYLVFSIAMVVTSLVAGPLIDRIGAARLVPLMLVPLAIAMFAVGWGQHQIWVLPYFVLAGASSGLSMTAVPALWPELYGTGHLGAIKSLVASLSVFASALGPVIMGGLMDTGLSIDAICYIFAAATLLGTACMSSAVRFTRSS